MRGISRDPKDLVGQTHGAHHQSSDGFMLFLCTMFSPIKNRDAPGSGFTHHAGDVVTIATPAIGALVNPVAQTTEIPLGFWHACALCEPCAPMDFGRVRLCG
jgi:fumarylacetoacetate (FAA) hydrolase family protein